MGLNADTLSRLRQYMADSGPTADGEILDRVFRSLARWRSHILANSLIALNGPKILDGPFAGMEYVNRATEGALLPRLVGSYESELHPHILAMAEEGLDQIVDVGCAEGYYAVGLARLMPNVVVHAYDIDPKARAACAELAARNGVSDRVLIGETFAGEDYAAYENTRTLIFMDIEGGEVQLLDPERFPALRTLKVIVETHGGPKPDLVEEMKRRFAPSHDIILVDSGPKAATLPPMVRSMSHLDQLIATWEWRMFSTPWLVMRPKAG